MADVILSRDADNVLSIIYKEYNHRLKNNIPKSNASHFCLTDVDRLFANPDIDNELLELKNNNFIEHWITGEFVLKSNGIIYMEQKIPNLIDKTIDTLSKFIP